MDLPILHLQTNEMKGRTICLFTDEMNLKLNKLDESNKPYSPFHERSPNTTRNNSGFLDNAVAKGEREGCADSTAQVSP